MSVLKKSYEVCKILKQIDFRDDIRQLIRALNSSGGEDGSVHSGNGHFGYVARQQRAQFMGYLIVDEKRDAVNDGGLGFIAPLSTKDKELLQKGHYVIKFFCDWAIRTVTKGSFYPLVLFDPYSFFSYPKYDMDVTALLEPNVFQHLAEEIKFSTPVQELLNGQETMSHLDGGKLQGLIRYFTNRVERYGVHAAPPDFVEMILPSSRKSREYGGVRQLFACMSLRQTMSNIAQLFFQAFLYDRLVVFNEENIIDRVHQKLHAVGEGLTLLIQPIGGEIRSEPGDIVLVKSKVLDIDAVCLINGIGVSFSRELGTTMRLDLRILDEELNPYFNLLS